MTGGRRLRPDAATGPQQRADEPEQGGQPSAGGSPGWRRAEGGQQGVLLRGADVRAVDRGVELGGGPGGLQIGLDVVPPGPEGAQVDVLAQYGAGQPGDLRPQRGVAQPLLLGDAGAAAAVEVRPEGGEAALHVVVHQIPAALA